MTYDTAETSAFGLQVTDYYRSLAHDSPSDPIRKQFIPTAFEFDQKDYETSDPLGESIHAVLPRLVHQYEDRVLLLVTDRCFVHCRHCFRRSFTGGQSGPIPGKELDDVLAYLKRHPEVQEILLSGGDPLTLTDRA
ncbi:MAG TPA: 4Fe-4S cluster-binding domain-containing protein, partial [Spirochaetia bacterium]|nr:4Fe-4S cluster-binding domain-containing protein [Spirochaetia bacterium]